jgi:hypothetical protein
MKDKVIEILAAYERIKDIDGDKYYSWDVEKAMLEFGYYVAEEQKKQCAEEAKLLLFEDENTQTLKMFELWSKEGDIKLEVNEDSILNSKNVCEQ